MGQIQDYIGYPGSQLNKMGTETMEFKNHLDSKMVIAEIKPCKSKIDKDGNIYQPQDAFGDFETDLANAGHSIKGKVLKIVISNPQSVTETYSNQFGDSEIFGGAGRSLMGGAGAELALITGTRDTDQLDQMAKDLAKDSPLFGGLASKLTGAYKSATDWAIQQGNKMKTAGNLGLGSALEKLGEVAKSPWSKVNWPQMWKNCSYQQSYELNTRLYCYYNRETRDYENNILAPLAALQLLVTPKSKDGILYTWPYIFDFKIDGVLHMPMAFCSNLSVVKGGDEGDFAADGRPNIIDIRMSIQNCYSVMVNCAAPKSESIPTVKRDSEGMQKGKPNSTGKPGSVGKYGSGGSSDGNSSPADTSSSASTSQNNNPSNRGSTAQQKTGKKGLNE